MQILKVEKCTVFFVETDDPEFGGSYRRGENGGWEQLMGESWESCYGQEDSLELAFQEFQHSQGRKETMTQAFNQYETLLRIVRDAGTPKTDRTGTGTRSVFGHQMRFDLTQGFPMVTTKKVHLKSIILELLWFLNGDTNVRWLQERGCAIWNEWADADGELGPVYGKQWRNWPTPDGGHIDQITQVLEQIKSNPNSRRMVVSAWNVAELDQMALMPCHCLFQLYVADGKLSCQLYQRSADVFLGVPFNIASYALLTHMMAQQCGLGVGDFVWTGGDCHLYANHMEQADLQLSRDVRPAPQLVIKRKPDDLFSYTLEDFELVGYDPHPAIKAKVAV